MQRIYKNIINILIKISILSSILFIVIYFGTNLIAKDNLNNTSILSTNTQTNNENYKNIKLDSVANVGIAMSTNIGIQYSKNSSYSSIEYKELFDVEELIKNNKNVKDELIGKNMNFLVEYHNFIKTDFNIILKSSSNKNTSIESIIRQLEIRFTQSLKNIEQLNKQASIISDEYTIIIKELDSLKAKLEGNFNSSKLDELYTDIDNYNTLKERETKLKVYIIIINNFLGKYSHINGYNKLLLDTLINNKDAIAKDTQIVIPDSGDELIDDFGLIVSEEEYKKVEENLDTTKK